MQTASHGKNTAQFCVRIILSAVQSLAPLTATTAIEHLQNGSDLVRIPCFHQQVVVTRPRTDRRRNDDQHNRRWRSSQLRIGVAKNANVCCADRPPNTSSRLHLICFLDPGTGPQRLRTSLLGTCCCSCYHIRRLDPSTRRKGSHQSPHDLCLDYCNSLLAGLPQSTLEPVQRVQNCAARSLSISSSGITSHQLFSNCMHWLPNQVRMQFKLCTLVEFKTVSVQRTCHAVQPA